MNFIKVSTLVVLLATLANGHKYTELISASTDAWADLFLSNVRKDILSWKLDPFKLPDIHYNFTYNFLWTEHEGEFNLTDGYLLGLSTIERNGNCILNYDQGYLLVKVVLKLTTFDITGVYAMHVLGINPGGNLRAEITEQTIDCSFLIDVEKASATLQTWEMPNDGKVKLNLDLGLLGDALAAVILPILEFFFKDNVIASVSNVIKLNIENLLGQLGSVLPPMANGTCPVS